MPSSTPIDRSSSTLNPECIVELILQFSFSFTISSLFRSTPLITTGEDSAPWMILTLLSWDLCPYSYLTSSSLTIGLIISSASSLTLVCIPHFHHVLLSSIHFLFYTLFLGPCMLVHSIWTTSLPLVLSILDLRNTSVHLVSSLKSLESLLLYPQSFEPLWTIGHWMLDSLWVSPDCHKSSKRLSLYASRNKRSRISLVPPL